VTDINASRVVEIIITPSVPQYEQLVDDLEALRALAELLRVSVPTVDRMRRDGMPCVTWGRRLIRFRASECVAWLEDRERGET
jgi:phage terminase Nu1 subunit (DNA packaging protein)